MSTLPALVFRLTSADHAEHVGHAIGRLLRAGDVLALDGELGAGKTTLIRGIASGLGLDPRQVSSPTFVIVTRYEQPPRMGMACTPLVHADAYRVSGAEELENAGWDAAVRGGGGVGGVDGDEPDAVICVEWAARVASVLGKGAGRATLQHTGEQERLLTLHAPEQWGARGVEWGALAALAERRERGPCPTCGRMVEAGEEFAPFDSARCRDVDLGKWLSGGYVVSREIEEEDGGREG